MSGCGCVDTCESLKYVAQVLCDGNPGERLEDNESGSAQPTLEALEAQMDIEVTNIQEVPNEDTEEELETLVFEACPKLTANAEAAPDEAVGGLEFLTTESISTVCDEFSSSVPCASAIEKNPEVKEQYSSVCSSTSIKDEASGASLPWSLGLFSPVVGLIVL